MNYPTHDTEWARTSKGNFWRRFNGKVMLVGSSDCDYYWAKIDCTFLVDKYLSPDAAKEAADIEVGATDDDSWWEAICHR